ncbi:MAG: hypothetical protein M1395_05130 [Bacteroidetes bacterium]|jgi:hypothetical protein|nr:hypothetical protein [Bacteroidota bacterium]
MKDYYSTRELADLLNEIQAHLSAGFVDVLVPTLKEAALQGNLFEVRRIIRAAFVSQPGIIVFHSSNVSDIMPLHERLSKGKVTAAK